MLNTYFYPNHSKLGINTGHKAFYGETDKIILSFGHYLMVFLVFFHTATKEASILRKNKANKEKSRNG